MRRVLIFGGTGFIGKHLVDLLRAKNEWEPVVLTRNAAKGKKTFEGNVDVVEYDLKNRDHLISQFENSYGIVNLAGESLAIGSWSKSKKERILSSRVNITRAISEIIQAANSKPEVLIQGSAVGYYGSSREKLFHETSPPGDLFLSRVVQEWEKATEELKPKDVRRVVIRTGVVIGKDSEVIKKMTLPFRMFVGGHFGDGNQWFPWIHIEDQVGAIRFLLEEKEANGIFNLVSPNPVRMKEFTQVLGKAVNRPNWFHVPAPFLRLLMGQRADEMLLSSQRIKTDRLLASGYKFKYAKLDDAIKQMFKK